jgi:hypothetical protein
VELMAESAGPSPGRIFISYRREETAYAAGWLFDRLADRFGGQVFKDVDSIELGDDFVEVITRAVGSCDVLLALIGDQWLSITDEDGRRRLDDPEDFVRLEIEAALTRNVRVIPILVDGARMPRADELPPSTAKLVRRHALELSPARFDFDTSRLLRALDKTLAEVRTAQQHPAGKSAPADKAPDLTTAEPPTAPERQQQAEPSPTHSIPPAVAAAPTGPSPSELSKPLDRSTREVKEAPEQGQRAESSLMPSVRPAAPATYREVLGDGLQVSEPRPPTGEAGTPPGEGRPSEAPSDREPDSPTRSRPTPRPSRRLLLALAAGLMLLVAGGLLGWQLWREDTVDTIPASMSGVWNGDVRVYDSDVGLTLRLTAESRSGRQETDPSDCRLNGTFSEISGTRSRVTMTFRPDDEDCLPGSRGTITLTTKGNDTLLAEFQPDDSGAGFWDAELRRQGG